MRDTRYAREIATAEVGNCRIERIYVKDKEQDEIRFSWWPEGGFANRPLDVPEDVLLALLRQAIASHVFSNTFLRGLLGLLAEHAEFPAGRD